LLRRPNNFWLECACAGSGAFVCLRWLGPSGGIVLVAMRCLAQPSWQGGAEEGSKHTTL